MFSLTPNHVFKIDGRSVTLTACLPDRRFGGAVAAGESISVRGVGSLLRTIASPVVREEDAGGEGQGLQSCMRCKCNAKPINLAVKFRSRRIKWVLGPQCLRGGNTPDFVHKFSNRTRYRAVAGFGSASSEDN